MRKPCRIVDDSVGEVRLGLRKKRLGLRGRPDQVALALRISSMRRGSPRNWRRIISASCSAVLFCVSYMAICYTETHCPATTTLRRKSNVASSRTPHSCTVALGLFNSRPCIEILCSAIGMPDYAQRSVKVNHKHDRAMNLRFEQCHDVFELHLRVNFDVLSQIPYKPGTHT